MAYFNSISRLYAEKRYSDVLNVTDWYQYKYPDTFTPEKAPIDLFYAADAAFRLGDFYRAAHLYRQLLDSGKATSWLSGSRAELARQRIERFDQTRPELLAMRCDSDAAPHDLMQIMRHLRYVYPRLSRPVVVCIVGSEAEYRDYLIQTGADPENLYPYKNFHACGFYHSDPVLRLIFKREHYAQYDLDTLTGTLAHEFAHFEAHCIKMEAGAGEVPAFKRSRLVEEHQTDLTVVSKGLAFPLYRAREQFGNHFSCLSAGTLKAYLEDLGSYYSR